MPVFRHASARLMEPFMQVILNAITNIAAGGGLDVVQLSEGQDALPMMGNGTPRLVDILLAKEGHPSVAVTIEVEPSAAPSHLPGYADVPAYGGMAEPVGPSTLGKVTKLLSKRAQDELASQDPPADDKPRLRDLEWAISLRTATGPRGSWSGGPFDTARISEALDKLIDLLAGKA